LISTLVQNFGNFTSKGTGIMNSMERRLVVALLITVGIVIFNVYIVLTGGAGNFYDYLS